MSLPGCYPMSVFGGYLKTSMKEAKHTLPDDGRFDVNCKLAERTVKMSEARILYENATSWEREKICSQVSSCGLKCYIN